MDTTNNSLAISPNRYFTLALQFCSSKHSFLEQQKLDIPPPPEEFSYLALKRADEFLREKESDDSAKSVRNFFSMLFNGTKSTKILLRHWCREVTGKGDADCFDLCVNILQKRNGKYVTMMYMDFQNNVFSVECIPAPGPAYMPPVVCQDCRKEQTH